MLQHISITFRYIIRYILRRKSRVQELDIGPKFNKEMFFTSPEFWLTNHAGLKERDCETISIAVGFRVVLEQ